MRIRKVLIIKLLATGIMLAVLLIPLNCLQAFTPEYNDFVLNYDSGMKKIREGTQKAVYMTGYSMGLPEKREKIYSLIEETELNSIVFNVKEDSGNINYNTNVSFFRETGSVRALYDIEQVIGEMDERGIYSIARIVLFKDGIIPEARPDLAIQDLRSGNPLRLDGSYWVDIYSSEIWEQYAALVLELIEKGIDEIQFDYVRAPSRGNISLARYPSNIAGREKAWAVTAFLDTIRKAAGNSRVKISADVYGFVLIEENDQGIGQVIEDVAPYLDFLYPMPYPSHYSDFFLGYSNPEEHPYEVVKYTLNRGLERIGDTDCLIIPWVQAFGLTMKYTEREILLQVKAAEELGIEGFLFWNAANNYSVVERALKTRK